MKPLVKNAADDGQVRKAEASVKQGMDLVHDALGDILKTEKGRALYWHLLCECGVFSSSFTGDNYTFFREGERNVGLKLLGLLNEVSPDAYVLMMKESKGRANV